MEASDTIWKEKLTEWRETHPIKAPEDLRTLRDEFIKRFPPETVGQLTLEQYALGHDRSHDSFCYWLEFKTHDLGSISGGSVGKFGVWWDKKDANWKCNQMFSDPQDALSRLTRGIALLVEAAQKEQYDKLDEIARESLGSKRYGLRVKPLSLYFPDRFLPIANPDHLRYFLSLFGQPTDGDVLALNRRLLTHLQSLPEFAGFEPLQMMRFLYDELPPTDQAPEHPNVWKISPGSDGEYWEMCRDGGCIVVHWLDAVDFREFTDKGAIKQALKDAGRSEGGARSIWSFTHEIKPDDIVVANKGNKTILGIGKVSSEYLPPDAPDNPSTDPQYRHARRVNWLITDPVQIPFTFGQHTVTRLTPTQWEQILDAYEQKYPELAGTLNTLGRKSKIQPSPTPSELTVPPPLERLFAMATRTRNIIVYGPPGTGKTWIVNHFANYFLLQKNVGGGKAARYWDAVLAKDTQSVQQLQREVQTDADDRVNQLQFWWVTANPRQWTWDQLFAEQEIFFERGRLSRNFDLVREGDLVFGYLAHPTKQVVAIARVKDDRNVRTVGEREAEGILLEPVHKLIKPVSWNEIALDPVLKKSEPVINNARGTLFRLTAEEANHFVDFLNARGNAVSLPMTVSRSYAEFVTFHQSFAYEEFVEGLKPIAEDGQVRYDVVDGVFRRICRKAEADPQHQYILVIDEINRANIAKVFGELITLIEDDKRLGQSNALTVMLPYSQERFGVPANLLILGTMNSADRSIALLDLALRRRFTFLEVPANPSLLGDKSVKGILLRELLTEINQRIATLLDCDHQIGHSYLWGIEDADDLHFVWYHRILPLLQEYFYGDGERLAAVVGDRLVEALNHDKGGKFSLGDLPIDDRRRYRIVYLEGEAFFDALRDLLEKNSA